MSTKGKIRLFSGNTEALLSTAGGSLQQFSVRGQDILYPETCLKINGQPKKRGGLPILFPWAGALGKLPQHGFARDLSWQKLSVHHDLAKRKARLSLSDNEKTLKIFPYRFRCELKIELGDKKLFSLLTVFNEDKKEMPLAPGFHPYFKMPTGLKNLKTSLADFDPKNYELGKTLFFPLQPVELLVPQLGRIKIAYGEAFNRQPAQLVFWSDQPDYFCVEAWAAPLGGFLREKERINLAPGEKVEFSFKIQVFLE